MEKIKLMLVDDHQLIIDGIRSLLVECDDIEIIQEANNGIQAIEKLKINMVDVLLIDIEMPIMNGLEATKLITSQFPAVKIIALTSFNEKAIIKKMFEAGAMGYLLKNTTKTTLIEGIRTVYKNVMYMSNEVELSVLKTSGEELLVKKNSSSLNVLSSREIEILKLIASGYSNIEIGAKIFISDKTVKTHRENIMKKLDLHNVVSSVRFAIDCGLIE